MLSQESVHIVGVTLPEVRGCRSHLLLDFFVGIEHCLFENDLLLDECLYVIRLVFLLRRLLLLLGRKIIENAAIKALLGIFLIFIFDQEFIEIAITLFLGFDS